MSGATASRRRDGSVLRSRAGRTLVALLGVGSVALTTAAAAPLDPQSRTFRTDVLAVGEGGLGAIDVGAADDSSTDAGREGRGTAGRDGSGPTGSTGPAGGTADDGGTLVGDGTVEVPDLGEGSFASFIPAGVAGGAGIPAPTLRAYRAAAEVLAREAPGCRIDWALLAGIGKVEANHGRFGGATVTDLGVSVPRILGPRLDGSLAGTMVIRDTDGGTLDGDAAYDRAVGPMQFLPGTWSRWGSDGDRDGATDPQDIDDAALAAARYLCEGRSGLDDRSQAALAVRRYNNSSSYVNLVLATAEDYRTGGGLEAPPGRIGIDPLDPFGDGGFFPFVPGTPPPPGWDLPPGTVVGQGPLPQPTASPTTSPSPTRTSTPSPTVTTLPSSQPSVPSSPAPSGSPTSSPPVEPSGEPTSSPTSSPTVSPSTSPSPTGSPTSSPTPTEPSPTCDPVPPSPTGEPSGVATAVPSAPPSSQPSSTAAPSGGVTVVPSLAPCPPPPCGTVPPSTVEPSPSPSCLPVPSGTTSSTAGPTP